MVAASDDRAVVDHHSHEFDGIEGHAGRLADDVVGDFGAGTRDHSLDEVGDVDVGERRQVNRHRVGPPGSPPRVAFEELGPGEGDGEDRAAGRTRGEFVDEVDHAFVGPMQVLEHHHGGPLVGNPLEESTPC